MRSTTNPRTRWLCICLALGLFALYVVHLTQVQQFFVDVPFMDGWENLRPGNLGPELDIGWFFKNHGDHVIVPTRIQTWLLYHLNSWNIETNLWINYMIWGLLVVMIFLVLRRCSGTLPTQALLFFMFFQLSAISWENHAWSFQSQFHWCLVFLMTSLFFLFDPQQRGYSLCLGCASLVFCLFSFSSGMAASFCVALGFGCFRVLRARSLDAPLRRREWMQTSAVLGVYILGVVFWTLLMRNIGHSSQTLVWPYQDRFWKYLFGLVSLGYGFNDASWPYAQMAKVDKHLYLVVDLALFACLIVPVILQLRRFRKLSVREFAVLSGLLAVLGTLSAISIGRSGYGRAQASRYSEMAILAVPFAMLAWQSALANRKRLRLASYAILATICLMGFHDDWDYADPARRFTAQRRGALGKIKDYYEKGGISIIIPEFYPWELKTMLDRARELRVSFYNKLQLEKR